MAMTQCKECGAQISNKAEKCPSCGAPAKKKSGFLKIVGIGFGSLLALGMCSAVISKKKFDKEVEIAAAAAQPTDGANRAPVAKSSLGDDLEFGKPTIKSLMGTMSQVLVEVRNKGTSGISCTLTATFKSGSELLGAAHGAVNDIPSGGTKTVQMMTSDNVDKFDEVKLETSACFPSAAKATAAGAAARTGDPLTFGKPSVKNLMGSMSQVLVEATNTTNAKLSCTVTATFKKGDEILDTATGALNEVPPGGTKTAQLMTSGSIAGYDSVILEGSTCF